MVFQSCAICVTEVRLGPVNMSVKETLCSADLPLKAAEECPDFPSDKWNYLKILFLYIFYLLSQG